MEAADGDCVFVAVLLAERAGLGEANVVPSEGVPPADRARLGGDELAVLRRRSFAALARRDWSRGGIFLKARKAVPTREAGSNAGSDRECSS